ncbi:hypothetical protein BH11BAC7_BH11BAC7_15980 [soil metagenome]
MKKLLLFSTLAFLFTTCSTDLDILDDWKETMVVYGLLDPSIDTQYVRIEKAFLGPDNALSMAQNFDSINYPGGLNVYLSKFNANGVLVASYAMNFDTSKSKNAGIFSSPRQVLYSIPTADILPFDATFTYRIDVSHGTISVNATTSLVSNFVISRPSGTTIDLRKITPTTKVLVEWNGSANARIYQVAARFYYRERNQSNVVVNKVAPDWLIRTVKTTQSNASSLQSIDFDPNGFYQYLANVLVNDPNVSAREADSIKFVVYAGGEALSTYMEVNAPSTSLAQEKPVYTNINGGLGVFSSRYEKLTNKMTFTFATRDTIAKGQFSCHLQFLDRNETILNNADLPPGCQ